MFSKMSISEDSEPERSEHEFIPSNNNSLFFPNEPTKYSSGTSNEQIDYDYIDFKYLEANSLNINFRRDKEWKSSPCLDEIKSLEEQLFHDTELTFAEKSVIYKYKEKLKAACKYCAKEFKILGKSLLNHESKCSFNPKNASSFTLSEFKKKVLNSKGSCPKCNKYFNKLRYHANDCFKDIDDFSSFIPTINLSDNDRRDFKVDTSLLRVLPFFDFEGPFTDKELTKIKDFKNHIERINEFKFHHNKKFIFLHLNINSVFNKVHELDEILNLCKVDVFSINESKLDYLVPISWYLNKSYNCIRLDREGEDGGGKGHGGGGNLVFVKKEYLIKKVELLYDIETIYFQLSINGQLANFLNSYRSPTNDSIEKKIEFLDKLETLYYLHNPYEPFFIFGDLNMDLWSQKGDLLRDFLIKNELVNYVKEHTRHSRNFYVEKNAHVDCKTLIDVAIHNSNKIISTGVIGCPFSDHKFVIAALDFSKAKFIPNEILGRSLSEKNLALIAEKIGEIAHAFNIEKDDINIDQIFLDLKNKITIVLDSIAPIKAFRERQVDKAPWEDEELYEKKRARDFYYFKWLDSNDSNDHNFYIELRGACQSLTRRKMIEYFESKDIKDFKNNKLYWEL